ncbi:MAG: GspH/FimT family pseudopilin [Saccharospirillum sp.]
MRRFQGFTLIELMVTLAVLAILAAIAAPSFQSVIENNRVASQANGLLAAAQLARSEAVRLGDNVSLTGLGTNAFEDGWCVHTGAGCTAATTLRRGDGVPANTVVASSASIVFDRRGEGVSGSTETIAVRPDACPSGENRVRVVSVSLVGRASVGEATCP